MPALLVQMNAGANAETDVRPTRPVRLGRQVSRPVARPWRSGRYVRAVGPGHDHRPVARPWRFSTVGAGGGGGAALVVAAASSCRCRASPAGASLPIAGREHARTHPPRSSPCGVLGPVGCGPYRTWPLPPQELVRCGAGAVSCHARAVLAIAAPPPCELRPTSTSCFAPSYRFVSSGRWCPTPSAHAFSSRSSLKRSLVPRRNVLSVQIQPSPQPPHCRLGQ